MKKTKSNQIYKNNPSSIVNDIIQLLFSMLVSHIILSNPLYGAALYLMYTTCHTIYLWTKMLRNDRRSSLKIVNTIFFLILSASASVLIVIFPLTVGGSETITVTLLILTIAIREITIELISKRAKAFLKLSLILNVILFSCLFFIIGAEAFETLENYIMTGLFVLSSATCVLLKKLNTDDADKPATAPLSNIASYSLFANMSFYSNIGLYLGLMMYMCWSSFVVNGSVIRIYIIIAAWLLLVSITKDLFFDFIMNKGLSAKLSMFIIGALSWCFASFMLFRTDSLLWATVWTFFWTFGLASMYAVTARLNEDFRLVTRLVGEEVNSASLHRNTILMQHISFVVAGVIMLCTLMVWSFILPKYDIESLPRYYRSWMILLPMLFMLPAMVFALKQPLDERNRQRLILFSEKKEPGEAFTNKLKNLFVHKYRVRFGVKIIMTMLRPFMRHKVYGTANLDRSEFPSIFVCNHGEIYGPIASVIYMPVYFRPWSDNRMLDRELIIEHMSGTFERIPLLSSGMKLKLAKKITPLIIWALSSFDPIPVQRSNPKEIMKTMKLTIDAMLELDNVLLFPEAPDKHEQNERGYKTSGVGDFYTGFAHLGKMYFDKTKRCVRFYPVFADKARRRLSIGKPVIYSTELPASEEKQRIANELRAEMLALSSE